MRRFTAPCGRLAAPFGPNVEIYAATGREVSGHSPCAGHRKRRNRQIHGYIAYLTIPVITMRIVREAFDVGISDAKKLIGQKCDVRWTDRAGHQLELTSMIHDVTFVPLYGGYLITDTEDIPLEKVVYAAVFGAAEAAIAA